MDVYVVCTLYIPYDHTYIHIIHPRMSPVYTILQEARVDPFKASVSGTSETRSFICMMKLQNGPHGQENAAQSRISQTT